MVGSAILRNLISEGHPRDLLLTLERGELDLTNQLAVTSFFEREKPDQVYIAAAKVGGILANSSYPADFLYTNLMIQANIIHASFCHGVKKIVLLGSSCIYPRAAPQPIREEALLSGTLEPTNEAYAIAKIAGIKLCESYNRQFGKTHGLDYRGIMPTNLYGPGDNYHPEESHVIPGLINRFHEAKVKGLPKVSIWGTGEPRREFLHVDDLASACVKIMNAPRASFERCLPRGVNHVNVGSGCEVTIRALAEIISRVVGYQGAIVFDSSKPDGTPRKWLDSSRVHLLGWNPKIDSLEKGLTLAYRDYLDNHVGESA